MANAFFYSNIAVPTTLSGNINNSVTSASVVDTTGWPSTPFVVALDFATANEELVKVTNNAAGSLTIVRGFGGTPAVSHSTGAVVRHVYNAQDATDYRTHEAATSGVHGIVGSFVGTSDSQTLTNKTLTAPTINNGAYSSGGSFSGTFTGTPTFSGALTLSGTPSISSGAALAGTFTGTPTFNGALTFSANVNFTGDPKFTGVPRFNNAVADTDVIGLQVQGESFDRVRINNSGKITWGTGAAARDTDLYRSGVKILGTTSTLRVEPTDTSLTGLIANLPSGTTGDLLYLQVNSTALSAVGSDGQFRIYGNNTPTTYTPTVTNGGSVTWTTRTGYWWRLGKIVFVVAYLSVNVAGSGTSNVAITMPSNVDRTTRQVLGMSAEGVGLNGHSHVVFFTGGSGATSDRIRSYDGQNLVGSDLLAGGILTIQGWYREA